MEYKTWTRYQQLWLRRSKKETTAVTFVILFERRKMSINSLNDRKCTCIWVYLMGTASPNWEWDKRTLSFIFKISREPRNIPHIHSNIQPQTYLPFFRMKILLLSLL